MSYLQSAYILISKPFAAINTEKSRTVRNVLVFLCFVSIFAVIMLYYTKLGMLGEWTMPLRELDRFHRALIECIILGIVALLSIEKGIKKVEWNWFVVYIWYTLGILIVISGIFHNIGYGFVTSQVALLLIVPLIFLAWQSRDDMDTLFLLMSAAIAVIVLIVGCIAVVKFPWLETTLRNGRYQGFLRNPNALGMVAVAGSIGAVYLCSCRKIVFTLLGGGTLGIALQLAWLCKSRSALLAIVMVLMVGLLLHIKNRCSFKSILALIVVAALVCGVMNIGIKRTDLAKESGAMQFTLISTVMAATDEDDNAVERLTNNSDSEDATSGRTHIWKEYIPLLNMTGHDVLYYLPIRVFIEETGGVGHYRNAHNSILDVGFRSGIPAAILLGLIELLALIYVLVRLVWKRKALRRADIFACSAMMAFFVVGLVEAIQDPLSEILAFLFFLSCGRLFTFGCEVHVDEVEAE